MTTLSLNDLNNLQSHPESKSCVIEYKGKVLGIYEEYAVFVLRINSEIDSIISKMELGKNYYNTNSEDAITNTICMMLQQKSISAEHGRYSSGETDLSVMHGSNHWIAEAKWWRQNENALEGMRQLSTRYANGGDNACAGGVLLYNSTGNLSDKIDRLKEIYSKKGGEFLEIKVLPCKESSFAFITVHKNASSGLNYEVRHRALNFYHNPKDKSARSRSSSV
jgi:hypothetical protein